ncbi:hypothetical protein PAHAL_9G174000 [Panicum hallii]|uniref:FRIGIDA-like protein n=2 Tax=Panicum hallii TaxID=206008 RepID=A0A2S3IKE4_9POAL|nr:hypothetical protein PAHAL_9G174000 [Panicum hallii]
MQFQPTPTSLPPVPAPTRPAAAMATQAELEAALQGKRRRLREAFDRLAACSPVPVPLRWEDLDAHLASVAARFGHFEVGTPHAADAAAAADAGPGTHNVVEHLEDEEEGEAEEEQDRERRGERGAWEEGQGSNAEEGEEGWSAPLDQERVEEEGEVREAFIALPGREGDEAASERLEFPVAIVPSRERDDGEEEDAMGATMGSPLLGDDDIEMMEEGEAANASANRDDGEDEPEDGELPRPRATAVGRGEETALTRAIAADPSTLVGLLCLSGKSSLRARREFLPALLGAADPHAILVRAVGGFLASAVRKTNRFWGNCVALIECVPGLAAPSADALEQAERVARDWKEMVVGKPWSGRDMSRMAGWGLLTFLASYNIVLEFDADEITRLFGNLAPQMKDNCVELCKRLGLIEKMTDSINHLIENGQPLDAIRLARTFNLTHRYPPLTIMSDYVENAKKTAEDILSKESYTLESLNQVMAKKVHALIFSWSAIDGCNIDPAHRNSIKAEITHLLHKYANKQQSLAGVSAFISSTHQEHNFQEQYHELQMPLEEQQQQRPQELQQMPEEEEQQHPQNQQEQGWVCQNRKGRKQGNKNRKRKQRRQKQQELSKRPRLSSYVRPGIHNQRAQPFSGIRRAPFTARTRSPPYFGPYDRFQPRRTE